jgi:hypothetical protein
MKGRDRIRRGIYENTPVLKVDVGDEPRADSNSGRALCVVDLQRDTRETFDPGEKRSDGTDHGGDTSGSRSIRCAVRDWSSCMCAASGGAASGSRGCRIDQYYMMINSSDTLGFGVWCTPAGGPTTRMDAQHAGRRIRGFRCSSPRRASRRGRQRFARTSRSGAGLWINSLERHGAASRCRRPRSACTPSGDEHKPVPEAAATPDHLDWLS